VAQFQQRMMAEHQLTAQPYCTALLHTLVVHFYSINQIKILMTFKCALSCAILAPKNALLAPKNPPLPLKKDKNLPYFTFFNQCLKLVKIPLFSSL
jgi:hypothetical protein